MTVRTVGLLSPGDMGHSVGAMLGQHGLRVLTCLEGRSERSRALAAEAGIEDTTSLEDLVRESELLLCVLVPSEAAGVAQRVAEAIGREGTGRGADLLYADCNAIAPRTAVAIGETITAAGARFADVGIIGGAPEEARATKVLAARAGGGGVAPVGGAGVGGGVGGRAGGA